MKKSVIILAVFCLVGPAGNALALITNVPANFYTDIGFAFSDPRAFADTAQEYPLGAFSVVGLDDSNPPDPYDPPFEIPEWWLYIEDVLTDYSMTSYGYFYPPFGNPLDSFVELGWNDIALFNKPGYNVAFFTIYTTTPYDIRLNVAGQTQSITPLGTGYTLQDFGGISAWSVTLAKLDLSDFGMAPGDSVNSIQIDMTPDPITGGQPFLSLVGYMHPIPAPGAVLLTGIGVGLLGWLRRRKTI